MSANDNFQNIPASAIPGWLSETEMRKLVGLKTTALWKLRTKGLVIWSKIGGRVFYKMDSVLSLLEKNQRL
jgi:hypothetical protein